MKIRFFLRGLGAGIVITALILCVSYRIHSPEQNVVEQAKQLGMVFPEGTAAPLAVSRQPKTSAAPQVSVQPVKPTYKSQTNGTAAADKKGKQVKSTPAQIRGTRFTVRSGLLSSSVAREMMEAGIIKSDKVLDEYLEKSGFAREIQSGTYFIPAGSTYEEIARIITGRQ